MNNASNKPEQGVDDQLSEFERRLRARSLGSRTHHRWDILYQCGYAAGVAETKKQTHRATVRWRLVGLAASVLACVSFSSHFFSIGDYPNGKLGMEKQVNPSLAGAEGTSSKLSSAAWIALLSVDRQADQQAMGILRASGTTLTNTEAEGLYISEPVGPENSGMPLRPSDFPLFL